MASEELKAQLVKHIDEALAMEQNVLRMLDGMIETTEDEEIKNELRQHKLETEQHADRMQQESQRRQHFGGRFEHAGDQQQVAHSAVPPLAGAIAPHYLYKQTRTRGQQRPGPSREGYPRWPP